MTSATGASHHAARVRRFHNARAGRYRGSPLCRCPAKPPRRPCAHASPQCPSDAMAPAGPVSARARPRPSPRSPRRPEPRAPRGSSSTTTSPAPRGRPSSTSITPGIRTSAASRSASPSTTHTIRWSSAASTPAGSSARCTRWWSTRWRCTSTPASRSSIRLTIAFSLPLTLRESGAPAASGQPDPGIQASGFALGDPRLGVLLRLWNHADQNQFSLHLGASVWIPVDAYDKHAGDSGLRVDAAHGDGRHLRRSPALGAGRRVPLSPRSAPRQGRGVHRRQRGASPAPSCSSASGSATPTARSGSTWAPSWPSPPWSPARARSTPR